jgi:hypothetical protein
MALRYSHLTKEGGKKAVNKLCSLICGNKTATEADSEVGGKETSDASI